MCIIVVKPAGVEFPTWKTLQTCFENNSDGAGIMWNGADGKVHISKGYMEYGKFRKALKKVKREVTDETAVVMHFRIKTHGEVSKECCHPFPVEGKLDLLRELEMATEFGVAHNGILLGMDTNAKKSDTMDYVMRVLYPLRKMSGENWLHDKYVRSVVESTLQDCRLAIIDGNGDLVTVGNFTEENGVLYSNNTYKQKTWASSYKGSWYPTKYTYPLFEDVDEDDDKADGADGFVEDYDDEELIQIMHNNCPCADICLEFCPDRHICEHDLEWYCRNEDECWKYIKDVDDFGTSISGTEQDGE